MVGVTPSAENRTRREAAKKEFVKLFDELTGYQHRWQAWQDMVWLFAATIANSIKTPHWEQREARYLEIIRKYDPKKQQLFPELFARLVCVMDDAVNAGDYGDFLGELYMTLGLGNDAGGQFFTPYSVCLAMSEITYDDKVKNEIARKGWISCNDCACGAGATLISMCEVLRRHDVNYQQHCFFVGQDIDYVTGLMCYIQLSLLGCAGYVHIGNTLTDPMTGHVLFADGGENTWYTPMYYSDTWELRRQCVRIRRLLGLPEEAPEQEAHQTAQEPQEQPTQEQAAQEQTISEPVEPVPLVETEKKPPKKPAEKPEKKTPKKPRKVKPEQISMFEVM